MFWFVFATEPPPSPPSSKEERILTFYHDNVPRHVPVSRFKNDIFPPNCSQEEAVEQMCQQLRAAKGNCGKQLNLTSNFYGTSPWWLMSDDEAMRVFAEIDTSWAEFKFMLSFVGNFTRRSQSLQNRIAKELLPRLQQNRQKIDSIQTLQEASELAEKLSANLTHLGECGIFDVEGWPDMYDQLYQKIRPIPQPFFYQRKIPVFTHFINCPYGSELMPFFSQIPLPVFRKVFVHILTYEMIAPGMQLWPDYAFHRLGSERAFFDCLWEARARKLLSPVFRLWRRIRFG